MFLMLKNITVLPFCLPANSADREVHAPAGREASATIHPPRAGNAGVGIERKSIPKFHNRLL
jgi:hypothetical protein